MIITSEYLEKKIIENNKHYDLIGKISSHVSLDSIAEKAKLIGKLEVLVELLEYKNKIEIS